MKKSSDIIGLRIISMQTGNCVGIVKQLLIDAANKTLAAMLIDNDKWYFGASIIPFSAVVGIGEDAVIINSESDLSAVSGYENLLTEDIKLPGSIVVSSGGNYLGIIDDFTILNNGEIYGFTLKAPVGSEVFGKQVVTYGKYITIISTESDVLQEEIISLENAPQEENVAAKPIDVPELQIAAEEINVDPTELVFPADAQSKTDDVLELVQEETELLITEPINEINEIAEVVNNDNTESPIPQTIQAEVKADEPDALAKMFEEKQRQYMLGKRASRKIVADNGIVIVDQGEEITNIVVSKAKLLGKFVELSMSIQ